MKSVDELCDELGVDPIAFLLAMANGDHKAIGSKRTISKKERRKAARAVCQFLYTRVK